MMMQKLAVALTKIYSFVFACLLLVLVVFSALRSDYFELGRDIEVPRYQWDKPILVVGTFILVILACSYWNHHRTQCPGPRKHVCSWLLVGIISSVLSLTFLLLLQSRPYMDCLALIENASAFNKGDYSSLSTSTHDSYLYVYPFQIGFIAYEQIVFRLFGDGNYFAVQVINVIGVFFMTICLYGIAGTVAGDKRTEAQPLGGILLILDFPLFIDVTFVYGDVLGWTFASAAFLVLLHWIGSTGIGKSGKDHKDSERVRTDIYNKSHTETSNKSSIYKWIPFLVPLLLTVGYLLKTNILIFAIAAAFILLVEALYQKRWTMVLISVLCIVMPLGAMQGIKTRYARLAGIDKFPEGTPAACWIAMGMLEDDNFEDGWYNGYNDTTFKESGYNPVIADEIARETIQERLHTFSHHPCYAGKFYLRKFVSAWNDPQFDSQIKMEWGSRHVENLNPVAKWMIYGSGRAVLYWIMNLLHFVILAAAFIGVIHALCSRDPRNRLALYLMLPVLGGMLFHLLWETQARYMIGYYSLLFPLAAIGVEQILSLRKCREDTNSMFTHKTR